MGLTSKRMSEHVYTLAELQELPFSEIRGRNHRGLSPAFKLKTVGLLHPRYDKALVVQRGGGKDATRVILTKPAEINAAVCNGYA